MLRVQKLERERPSAYIVGCYTYTERTDETKGIKGVKGKEREGEQRV